MANIRTFNFSVNLLQSILWEWDGDPGLTALIQSKQDWYNLNQTGFWESWISDVFDLRTANEFGCVVWAIILGFPLTYILGANDNNMSPFGFGPDDMSGPPNGNQNFFNSNFASNQTEQFILTLPQKRLLLQLRYRQLVSRGTVPEINKILADLLVPLYGPMYVVDGLDMTMRIVCVNGVPAFLGFLFSEFDLIPRPEAVSFSIVDPTQPVFGFGPDNMSGPPNGNQNFFNSNFTSYPA